MGARSRPSRDGHQRSTCPRISPPGKSPGPVLTGAVPSFVCTLT